jgi:hypothetical protein
MVAPIAPVSAARHAGRIAGLLMGVCLLAAGGCAGVRPTLGPPPPSGTFVYQPPEGSRFDYFVYMGNADHRVDDRQTRLERVRAMMAQRCENPMVVDLYGHRAGFWPDGTEHITYTVGVDCAPHAGMEP